MQKNWVLETFSLEIEIILSYTFTVLFYFILYIYSFGLMWHLVKYQEEKKEFTFLNIHSMKYIELYAGNINHQSYEKYKFINK